MKYVCMCPCMTTDTKAILTGMEFISYCNVNGLDPDKHMFEIDGENIYKMWIVDFLISNRDRHGQNWDFFMIRKRWRSWAATHCLTITMPLTLII